MYKHNRTSTVPVEFHRYLAHAQTVETRPLLLAVSGLGTRLKAYQLCVSQKYNQNNEETFFHYCTTVFTMYPPLILVSSPSSPVSRGRGGGGTGGELAPSLLIAPRRRLLLIVAGDVETNPGPYGE